MAEEFQAAGICGDNWWNISSRSVFGGGGGLPCSAAVYDMMGSYGWPADVLDLKPRSTSCIETNSVSDSSMVLHDAQKPQQQIGIMDSTLHMMGFGFSPSSASDWNQSFFCDNGTMLQEEMSSKLSEIDSSQIQKDFSSGSEDTSINAFKPLSADDFTVRSSGTCTPTCQGLPVSFPLVSSSPSYGYQPTMLNGLLNHEPQLQQSLYNNGSMAANYEMNSDGFSPSWMKASLPKLQPSDLHYNIPFSNVSTTVVNNLLPNLLPSGQANFLGSNFEEKNKRNLEQVGDVKKSRSETSPPSKRHRIGTPSPLPTFKVRKEKLGDRITALQQLVSPFGKTDTASVLQEAIEYIKFLHDQVNTLSNPYMKNGASNGIQQQQVCQQNKGTEESKQDLRSRGLCLVPLSSTFPVASETTADFWTPTFGGPFG